MTRTCLPLLFALVGVPALAGGETPAAKPQAKTPTAESLSLTEQQLADRYRHLEEVLLRMAELTAPTDPRRAALLKKAVGQSKQQLIGAQFEQLVKLLEKDQLARAVDHQRALGKDLQGLLELLMSENRAQRLESEKARMAQYLKQIGVLLREQKGLQARAQSAAEPKSLATPQRQTAEKTGALAQQIQATEETPPANPGAKAKPSSGKQSQPGAKPQDAPAPFKAEAPQPAEQGHPVRKRLQAAEQRMREAEKRLAEAKRKAALEEQEEALRELELAKHDLEKILRQLREEEMERVLAMLEARLLKMLKLQRDVFEGTLRLDKVPPPARDHNHEIEAGRLSSRQVEIVVEADRALLVLREDGTAMALPEALRQARQDMQQVVEHLAEDQVGKVTQALEEEIISALQEMLESLKRAQKKLQDKKRRPPSNAQPGQEALVDILSELKMIRTLQLRVNSRTEPYAKLVDGEQATNAELLVALERLAARQQRIYEITRDLELGKNR